MRELSRAYEDCPDALAMIAAGVRKLQRSLYPSASAARVSLIVDGSISGFLSIPIPLDK